MFSDSDRASDLNAVISSVYRYQNSDDNAINRLIHQTGRLSVEEAEKCLRLYKATMEDILEFFKKDPGMERYIKWDIS